MALLLGAQAFGPCVAQTLNQRGSAASRGAGVAQAWELVGSAAWLGALAQAFGASFSSSVAPVWLCCLAWSWCGSSIRHWSLCGSSSLEPVGFAFWLGACVAQSFGTCVAHAGLSLCDSSPQLTQPRLFWSLSGSSGLEPAQLCCSAWSLCGPCIRSRCGAGSFEP